MRQTSVKWSPGEPETTFAPTSPQITLCCRLLHCRGHFSRCPAGLTIGQPGSPSARLAGLKRAPGAANSVGWAAQERWYVEQVVFLAQIRPVVRLQRRERGLSCRLAARLSLLDGRAGRGRGRAAGDRA